MATRKKAKKGAGKKDEVLIAPSILSADFGRLAEEVKAVTKAGADWIHVDVMDGRFVPNITIGPMFVEVVRRATDLPIDVHLMIVEPEKYIDDFVRAGADVITVHVETCPHLHRAVQQIREAGEKLKPRRKVKAAVTLNPHTSLSALDYILPDVDMVLLMSVNPGFGGQKFIPQILEKTFDLKWIIDDFDLDVDIQIDGGVKIDNIRDLAGAGARIFVAGSAVFGQPDYAAVIRQMKENARAGIEEYRID